MLASTEMLLHYVSRDYPHVLKETRKATQLSTPIRVDIRDIKPFTMVNLTLANEFKLDERKRIACAAFVDLSGRLISLLDDLIDENWKAVASQMKLPSVEQEPPLKDRYASIASLSALVYFPLYSQIETRVINADAVATLVDGYARYARVMFDGISWQHVHGYFQDKVFTEHNSLDIDTIFTEYVDKIAGGLFAWSVDPIGVYEERVQKEIRDLLPGIYSFARIFQTNDDIIDVFEDLRAKQHTIVLTAFSTEGTNSERQKLLELSGLVKGKITPSQFQKYFPATSQMLGKLKNEQYAILEECIGKTSLGIRIDDVKDVSENYPQIRSTLNAKIFH